MTTQQIAIFLESAKQLNFTTAAEHLFLTQPTLSRQIGLLESELNTKLFNRVNNAVSLTPSGEILQRELGQISDRFNQLHYLISSANCGLSGALRIGISREMAFPALLKQAVRRFHAAYPQIEIAMQYLDVGQMYESVHNCTLDIGLNSRSNKDIDIYAGKLEALPFEKQTECLAIRHGLIDNPGNSVTLDDCAAIVRQFPLYMVSITSFNNPMKSYENDAYFMVQKSSIATPQRLFERLNENRRMQDFRFTKNIESVFMAVECGLGCTFTDTGSRLAGNRDVQLLPIQYPANMPVMPVEPSLFYNTNNANPTLRNFLEIFRALLS